MDLFDIFETITFKNFLGFFAAFCTTLAFVPQVIKIWKTKSTKDISLLMFVIFTLGIACGLFYGILNNDKPLIIANLFTLLLSLYILIQKIINR